MLEKPVQSTVKYNLKNVLKGNTIYNREENSIFFGGNVLFIYYLNIHDFLSN